MAKDALDAAVRREVKAQLESLAGRPVPDQEPQPHVRRGLTDTATAAVAGSGASLLLNGLLQPQDLLDHGTVGVIVYGVLAVALVAAGVVFGWLRSRQG